MVWASRPWMIWGAAAEAHLARTAGVLGLCDLAPLVRAAASSRGDVGGFWAWISVTFAASGWWDGGLIVSSC